MRVVAGLGAFLAWPCAQAGGQDLDGHRPVHRPGPQGWPWRTLERYWELTGDKRAEELLKAVIKANEPLIGQGRAVVRQRCRTRPATWFTQIFSRAAAMTALHTGDPRPWKSAGPWPKARKGPRLPWQQRRPMQFSDPLRRALSPDRPGEYKAALADAIKGDGLLSVGGYFPASDHWLLTQPPKDKPQ